MSGRRLRHVNAEKKLEEWKAEAEDRRLEKLAEQFLKKKSKEVKKNSSVDVDKYLEKYREDSAKCMEEVEESVRNSFGVYRDLKRKMCPVSDRSSKKLKIWLGKAKMDDSCSEDDDEFEEKSVVLDDGTSLEKNNVIEGSSSMSAGSGSSSVESMIPETAFGSACIPKAVVPEEDMENKSSFCSSEPIVDNEAYVQSTTNSSFEEPLNFDHYKSAEELMVLGMERLKLGCRHEG
ncbi:hypothetical protein HPP92_024432 [Vanilla planifolia]|uniref:SDE2-like domain-containing protein n=1 Tax=Vanilla planifolia TaxID=51239 RepID=A0A835UBJ0_VANPL|nr:hypothetical protein HPP92_024432 [Vanilla planifolia]